MASMRDIKRRRNSVQSTQQITKAMKLVSTVKLQKAKLRAESSDPYFRHTYSTVSSILQRSGNIDHPYLTSAEGGKKAVILISGNRGLAGGYNSNVIKLLTGSGWSKDQVVVYAVGGKGSEYLSSKGYEIRADYSDAIEAPTFADAKAICDDVLAAYREGEISQIHIAYTHFKNTVSYTPTMLQILPVSLEDEEDSPVEDNVFMNYEPSEEEALEMIIPKYLTSLIYGALIEAVASENGARMTAMDSATNNAEEIISDLTLKYNRARQGAITREITEIVAGADALS